MKRVFKQEPKKSTSQCPLHPSVIEELWFLRCRLNFLLQHTALYLKSKVKFLIFILRTFLALEAKFKKTFSESICFIVQLFQRSIKVKLFSLITSTTQTHWVPPVHQALCGCPSLEAFKQRLGSHLPEVQQGLCTSPVIGPAEPRASFNSERPWVSALEDASQERWELTSSFHPEGKQEVSLKEGFRREKI